MHPAPSVILFTALSGLGFGLLFFLALDSPDIRGLRAFGFFFVGFALAVGGLLISTLHLGNPKNSLKAFSQWRTSWLSREGIASIAALIVIGLYAGLVIFFDIKVVWLGWIGAGLALLAVFCTSMIYASLRTIPRWNHWTVPVLFMLYTLSGGALCIGFNGLAIVLLVILGGFQIFYWGVGDGLFARAGSTIASATGLGALGSLRQFEPPHTGSNFLLDEMVYQIGRKHTDKLRVLGFAAVCVVPVGFLVTGLVGDSVVLSIGAVAFHFIGLVVCRWLFFAQAEHVVGLYYGADFSY